MLLLLESANFYSNKLSQICHYQLKIPHFFLFFYNSSSVFIHFFCCGNDFPKFDHGVNTTGRIYCFKWTFKTSGLFQTFGFMILNTSVLCCCSRTCFDFNFIFFEIWLSASCLTIEFSETDLGRRTLVVNVINVDNYLFCLPQTWPVICLVALCRVIGKQTSK